MQAKSLTRKTTYSGITVETTYSDETVCHQLISGLSFSFSIEIIII